MDDHPTPQDQLRRDLIALYGEAAGRSTHLRLLELLQRRRADLPPPTGRSLSQADAILITYGDIVQSAGRPPLQSLASFLSLYAADVISSVHVLPFYPYSSDDGFSVIDYYQVDPQLGDWSDIAELGQRFTLMFDAVINHISAQSDWFQAFLRAEPPYDRFFTVVDPATDLSQVFRPRALPLLTRFETATGSKHVWTTFSEDQIDLNFANPEVLLQILDVLLTYVARGARFIRLDAVGFMWKEIGTSCIHRPQTHMIIQLMRRVLDMLAPQVALITETNVPHKDNISYFGDGHNEAQMVYNFSLPPLTLHAFHTGDATALTEWAASLELPSDKTTFFNFLASHDGIGVTPARGILPEAAIAALGERVQALGGHVSYKTNPDGSQSAYELNINYLDALGDPSAPDEPVVMVADRFLAAQAIMLALRGVPGIYFHSLFGSRSWPDGVALTGRYRTINRQRLSRSELDHQLAEAGSLRTAVFSGYRQMLLARRQEEAFHPYGRQTVLALHPGVFALWRRAGSAHVLCLHNVTAGPLSLRVPASELAAGTTLRDLLSGSTLRGDAKSGLTVKLDPYQVAWLKVTGI